MQFPIHIELHRSRILTSLLCFIHVLAAGCIVVLPWRLEFRFLLLLLIVLSAWRALRSLHVAALCLLEDGGLDCVRPNGERISATVLPGSTVFSRLIVLRLRLADQAAPVVLSLLPDSMTPQEFRVLRVCLRWRVETGA